jgi:hypothetical protein
MGVKIIQRLKQWWRVGKIHVVGPIGSIIFHILLILVLVKFAVSTTLEKAPSFEVVVMEPTESKLDDTSIKEIEKVIEKIEPVTPPPELVDHTLPPSDVPSIGEAVGVADVAGPSTGGSGGGTGTGDGIGTGDNSFGPGFEISTAVRGPLVMRGLYANRTAGGRKGALTRYGGSGTGELSVNKALKWLMEHQNPNGSWPGQVGLSGLALLTFLAHGMVPSSPVFGPTVEKAIKHLIAIQTGTGSFSPDAYSHGIATYAMSEAYALTKIMAVREAMDKAVEVIIAGQQEKGGFNYGYDTKSDRWDMSVCGWQYQAMKAAKMAGCANPELDKAIEKSIAFLKEWAYSGTGWGYSGQQTKAGGGTTPAMTGAGALALQLLGQGKCPQVRSALKYLEAQACSWPRLTDPAKLADARKLEKATVEAKKSAETATEAERAAKEEELRKAQEAEAAVAPKAPIYGWYYITQVKFQEGGGTWDAWNKQFQREITLNQKEDGHWDNGDYEGHAGGACVYTTCMCALTLQVYYRYLPTYKKVDDTATETATSPDDVNIKVL